jgi:hypothetical protein
VCEKTREAENSMYSARAKEKVRHLPQFGVAYPIMSAAQAGHHTRNELFFQDLLMRHKNCLGYEFSAAQLQAQPGSKIKMRSGSCYKPG